MPGKLRVHELAKQLGVTSKELLATLKEQGEFVKTASSTIEPPVIKKMKQHYAAQDPTTAQGSAKTTPEAAKATSTSAKPAAPKPAAPKPASAKPAAPKPAAAKPAACSRKACSTQAGFREASRSKTCC
ncbi:hypothetical protein KPHES18091_03990 [Corynebacterium ulcerans]